MDINELNKKQLVLLTLLITFVVSIGTGIVTVSLMKQIPPTVPQTINNVIQRTIEKVTTIEQPKTENKDKDKDVYDFNNGNQLITIFKKVESIATGEESIDNEDVEIGKGVIISDEGLILINTNTISEKDNHEVMLGEEMFDVYVLKKFDNGFSILKIGQEEIKDKPLGEIVEENKAEDL